MIIASLVLVVVSAISLFIGIFLTEELVPLYIAIGTALLAFVFLVVAWLRGRRRTVKPVTAATISGDEPSGAATWKGAGWGGSKVDDDADVLTRDQADSEDAAVIATTESPNNTEVLNPVEQDVFKPPAAPQDRPLSPKPPPTAPREAEGRPAGGDQWKPPPPPGAPGGKPAPPPPLPGNG